jgi:hypothetical protein
MFDKFYTPTEFLTVPFEVLTKLPKVPEVKTPVKHTSINNHKRVAMSLRGVHLMAEKCHVLAELLRQCVTPPIGKGMSHQFRWRLAQILRQAGVQDIEIARLFDKQPNYNFDYSLRSIRSVNLSFPPPSCRAIAESLGLCNGRCSEICDYRGGSPISFVPRNGGVK